MIRLNENDLNHIIKNILVEVKYLKHPNYNNNNFEYENSTLNDNETIRVYHGFNSLDDAIIVANQGLSGKSDASQHKIYSYESGNNPYGLFVSVDFNVIKRNFSHGGVIIEFSTKVSDLEAPVWSGQGSFFGQGSYTKSFKNKEDREEQRLNYRKNSGNDEYNKKHLPNISQSERPELADSLLNSSEKQALYIGDLNPNMIKRFWVHENIIKNRNTTGEFKAMSRNEFLKQYGGKEISNYNREKHPNKSLKLFYPNDNFDLNKLNPMFDERKDKTDRYKNEVNRVIGLINNGNEISNEYGDEIPVSALKIIDLTLWPKQIIQAIGKENYNKYYNSFL